MSQNQKLKERAEAHLKSLKIPREIEDDARQLVQSMLSHESFGNPE